MAPKGESYALGDSGFLRFYDSACFSLDNFRLIIVTKWKSMMISGDFLNH